MQHRHGPIHRTIYAVAPEGSDKRAKMSRLKVSKKGSHQPIADDPTAGAAGAPYALWHAIGRRNRPADALDATSACGPSGRTSVRRASAG